VLKIKGPVSKLNKLLLGIAIFAVLWCVLWAIFPMAWYSLFMANMVGSNVYILLFCFIIAVLTRSIFNKLWRIDLPFVQNTFAKTLMLIATIYIYSIFLYSDYWYILLIYLVAYVVINAIILNKVERRDPKVVKPLIKRNPVLAIVYAIVLSAAENISALLIFVVSMSIFLGTATPR
jgi:hypothetical protein